MLRNVVRQQPLKAVRRLFLCLGAMTLLSGCVSAVQDGDLASGDSKKAPMAPSDPVAGKAVAAKPGYVDPAMVSSASAKAGQPSVDSTVHAQAEGQLASGQAPQMGGLVTQPTGIAANSQSIFANPTGGGAAVVGGSGLGAGTGSIPAYAPSRKIAPSLNSVYSAPPMTPAAPTSALQEHSAAGVPQNTNAATETSGNLAGQGMQTAAAGHAVPGYDDLLAAQPKAQRGAATARRGPLQVAALPRSMMPSTGGSASMSDAFDETQDDDDKPAGLMKLVSLPGLTRIAPNGLVLQTDQVEVGCFKPELTRRIKEVEAHYGRPAIITSGYRPPKGVTQHSKHYSCEAADIQIKGVSKWDLASYLRSLPDRGGVGTYCHTESVHLDIGEPRDWNWRCRRTGTSL